MKKLHRDNKTALEIDSEVNGQMSLSSNRRSCHPSFLEGLPDPNEENEEILIDCLANILVEIFLTSDAYYERKEESCNLLPSINEGTS